MHGNTSKRTCLAAFLGLEHLVKYAHLASRVIESGPCRRLEIERPIIEIIIYSFTYYCFGTEV